MIGIVFPLSSWKKALLPPSCREQTETQRGDGIFHLTPHSTMILTQIYTYRLLMFSASHHRQVLRVPFSRYWLEPF